MVVHYKLHGFLCLKRTWSLSLNIPDASGERVSRIVLSWRSKLNTKHFHYCVLPLFLFYDHFLPYQMRSRVTSQFTFWDIRTLDVNVSNIFAFFPLCFYTFFKIRFYCYILDIHNNCIHHREVVPVHDITFFFNFPISVPFLQNPPTFPDLQKLCL